jgi:hypothetical protein
MNRITKNIGLAVLLTGCFTKNVEVQNIGDNINESEHSELSDEGLEDLYIMLEEHEIPYNSQEMLSNLGLDEETRSMYLLGLVLAYSAEETNVILENELSLDDNCYHQIQTFWGQGYTDDTIKAKIEDRCLGVYMTLVDPRNNL